MMRRLQAFLGFCAYHTGLHRLFLRRRAVIVLFHRIDDGLKGNPISCSRREFQQYCDFFQAHFVVVSLRELLQKLERDEDVSAHLAITFDDGYKDNHEVAAQELQKRGLPACFFIATGFIGSDLVPWWDAELSIKSEWMSWDDVRSLQAQGFELGSHTINHLDLTKLSGEEAQREIAGSRQDLVREIGTEPPYFSYPYGRQHQITEENRRMVREAGFRCCVSAYGGTVPAGTDPFYLRRAPISPWYVSPYHFGFEVMS